MKVIIFLLFVIFAFSGDATYSIDALLDYLQETGFYEIIFQVKNNFGNDVAIDFCKGIVKNAHCEEVIRVYMPESSGLPHCPKDEMNLDLKAKPSENFIKEIKILLKEASQVTKYYIIFFVNNYNVLITKMNEKDILKLIKNFIDKYGNKNICQP